MAGFQIWTEAGKLDQMHHVFKIELNEHKRLMHSTMEGYHFISSTHGTFIKLISHWDVENYECILESRFHTRDRCKESVEGWALGRRKERRGSESQTHLPVWRREGSQCWQRFRSSLPNNLGSHSMQVDWTLCVHSACLGRHTPNYWRNGMWVHIQKNARCEKKV